MNRSVTNETHHLMDRELRVHLVLIDFVMEFDNISFIEAILQRLNLEILENQVSLKTSSDAYQFQITEYYNAKLKDHKISYNDIFNRGNNRYN